MSRAGLDADIIIRSAAALADANGLESVTLAAVAAALHVKTPSLYNHLGGMTELKRGLALAGLRELEQRLGKSAIGKAGDEALRSAAAAYLDYAREHPGLYEATVAAPDPADAEVKEAAQRVVDVLLQVLQHYKLRGEAAIHVVRGWRSLAHGFASLEFKGGFGLPLDNNESFAKLIELFIKGLHASLEHPADGGKECAAHDHNE